MIYIVNKKTYTGNIPFVYVGRPMVLGNPYSLSEYTREESINKYRIWLNNQFNLRGAVYNSMIYLVERYRKTEDLALMCWCAPLPCHADVIKEKMLEIL